MSQSSKPFENKDVISKPSSVKVEDKSENAAVVNRTQKRGLTDQVDEQAKKIKLADDLTESVAPANVQFNNKPNFVNASQLIRHHTHTTVQSFQEISDEELLEMTIQFEKDHPEYN